MENTGDTPSAPSQPKPELQREDDPRKYMQAFQSSDAYTSAFERFYAGKALAPDVTESEKREVFESGESGKDALLDFAQNDLRFTYNPDKFDSETKEALGDYIATVKDYIKIIRSGSQDEIISADIYRSTLHNKAAKILADNGYVSSDKLGRTLARIILIDKGLDTFENAGISDLQRLKRQMGATS